MERARVKENQRVSTQLPVVSAFGDLEEKGELNKRVVKMDTYLQVLNVRQEGTRLDS